MKTDKINLPTAGKCYCYPPQNAHTNLRAENNADICLFLWEGIYSGEHESPNSCKISIYSVNRLFTSVFKYK